jgi:hypothetical protein
MICHVQFNLFFHGSGRDFLWSCDPPDCWRVLSCMVNTLRFALLLCAISSFRFIFNHSATLNPHYVRKWSIELSLLDLGTPFLFLEHNENASRFGRESQRAQYWFWNFIWYILNYWSSVVPFPPPLCDTWHTSIISKQCIKHITSHSVTFSPSISFIHTISDLHDRRKQQNYHTTVCS